MRRSGRDDGVCGNITELLVGDSELLPDVRGTGIANGTLLELNREREGDAGGAGGAWSLKKEIEDVGGEEARFRVGDIALVDTASGGRSAQGN